MDSHSGGLRLANAITERPFSTPCSFRLSLLINSVTGSNHATAWDADRSGPKRRAEDPTPLPPVTLGLFTLEIQERSQFGSVSMRPDYFSCGEVLLCSNCRYAFCRDFTGEMDGVENPTMVGQSARTGTIEMGVLRGADAKVPLVLATLEKLCDFQQLTGMV
jgi:hypothetical protein